MAKILIGFSNTAGLGARLKRGFEKNGISADFYSFRKHPYGYESDILLKRSKNRILSYIQILFLIIKFTIKYDILIYIGSGTALTRGNKEIKFFKKFKKKTVMVYVGCDVRIPDRVEKFEWNSCSNCSKDYMQFVGCNLETKTKRIRKEEILFDYIFSPHECAGYLEKKYSNILFPIDLTRFIPAQKTLDIMKKIRIIHAPSNEGYKGSIYVYDAISRLQDTYNIEFVKLQNVNIDVLYEEINKSDLVIDQMLVGFYGLFAIESMALSKPVICYVREEYLENECPIINANPDTLYEVLVSILSNPGCLSEIGCKSRRYVEKYHADSIVAAKMLSIIQS